MVHDSVHTTLLFVRHRRRRLRIEIIAGFTLGNVNETTTNRFYLKIKIKYKFIRAIAEA